MSTTTGQPEIMDMQGFEVDTRAGQCYVEFTVWCPKQAASRVVGCRYLHSSGALVATYLPGPGPDENTVDWIVGSAQCKADAKEYYLATRDFNREQN